MRLFPQVPGAPAPGFVPDLFRAMLGPLQPEDGRDPIPIPGAASLRLLP